MATRSPAVAETFSSLDISACSKEKDNRIQVWTTENNEQNGGARIPDVRSTEAYKSPLNNGLPNEEKISRGKNEPLEPQPTDVKPTWSQKYFSWRFFMVLLLQSSIVVSMFMRTCLPMTLVCMVRPRTTSSAASSFTNNSSNRTDYSDPVELFENASFSDNNTYWKGGSYEFDWSSDIQGLLLTSTMFTGFTGPALIGILREHLGTKRTMSVTNLIATLLTFLSPLGARISPYCLVAIRMCLGISLGGNIPVIGDCLAWWAPHDEKLTMISLTYTGANIGIVLSTFLSGYLCLVPIDNGWPFVFYTFGTVSLLWGICWHFLSSHKPEDHPFLSEKEKQYIISHRVGMDAPSGGKKVKPPYRKLLTSVPVLAYITCGTCSMWAFQVFFTYLPSFFNKRLQYAVQETGMLTSMTSACRMLGVFFWTALGNRLTTSLGPNRARKICLGTGFFLAGVSTITIGFFDDNYKWLILVLLTFVMINQSVRSSALVAVPLDMAPRYAGLISGMSSSVGGLVAISGPLLTAALTPNGTIDEWRTVWFIMGSVFITGATVFLIFGQVSLQPWAQGKTADAPHIITPFVTMGRNFSFIMEYPPLSSLTPIEIGNNFSLNVQTPADKVLAQDEFYTREILKDKHLNIDIRCAPEAIVKSSMEIEHVYDKDNFNSASKDYKGEVNAQEQENNRKEANSDFDFTTIKPNVTYVGRVVDLEEFTFLDENATDVSEKRPEQNCLAGNVNEAYEDLHDGIVCDTGNVQIWRL